MIRSYTLVIFCFLLFFSGFFIPITGNHDQSTESPSERRTPDLSPSERPTIRGSPTPGSGVEFSSHQWESPEACLANENLKWNKTNVDYRKLPSYNKNKSNQETTEFVEQFEEIYLWNDIKSKGNVENVTVNVGEATILDQAQNNYLIRVKGIIGAKFTNGDYADIRYTANYYITDSNINRAATCGIGNGPNTENVGLVAHE